MNKTNKHTGGQIPPVALLDRLSGVDSYQSSILAELERLLNTRRSDITPLAKAPGVAAYGIPDLSTFTTANEGAASRIIDRIEKAICLFEPRLRGTQIGIEQRPGEPDRLDVTIQAQIRKTHEPFHAVLMVERRK